MKNKLKFLIKQSLQKKTKTKWFKAVNILLLCLILLIANIDKIISLFGGEFKDTITIYVHDETSSYELFERNFLANAEALNEMKNYKIEESTETVETLKERLNEETRNIIVTILSDEANYIKGEIISFEDTGVISKQLIIGSLNAVKETLAIQNSGLTEEEILALTKQVEVETILTNPETSQTENKDLIAMGVTFVIILPCFFLILMLVQMIGAEINDEKTTRSMEIIISNVSPQTHFLSKIASSTLFVILQGALLLLYGFLAILLRSILNHGNIISGGSIEEINQLLKLVQESGILTTFAKALPLLLVLFLTSFIAYAILAGVLASMTTSIEDFQQLQTPLMLIIMLGYYLSIMASQFDGSIFIKIVSFIPMLSFLISPVLFMLGQIGILELLFTAGLNIGFTYVLFKYGLRIYKVGILNYSSSKLWKKMFHSLKQEPPKRSN